jgi:hypothetical protein
MLSIIQNIYPLSPAQIPTARSSSLCDSFLCVMIHARDSNERFIPASMMQCKRAIQAYDSSQLVIQTSV